MMNLHFTCFWSYKFSVELISFESGKSTIWFSLYELVVSKCQLLKFICHLIQSSYLFYPLFLQHHFSKPLFNRNKITTFYFFYNEIFTIDHTCFSISVHFDVISYHIKKQLVLVLIITFWNLDNNSLNWSDLWLKSLIK